MVSVRPDTKHLLFSKVLSTPAVLPACCYAHKIIFYFNAKGLENTRKKD